MSTSTENDVIIGSQVHSRVLREGYGSGAWHGPDLKAALADVPAPLANWRPGAGRHNIAEIALHHAYCIRSVRTQISGRPAEPFPIAGEDWFEVNDERPLSWSEIQALVDAEQERLLQLVAGVEAGTVASTLSQAEQFGLVLGITCHAVYHAGQVQLIKRLRDE